MMSCVLLWQLGYFMYEFQLEKIWYAVSMYEFLWIHLSSGEIDLTSDLSFGQVNKLTIRAYSIK